MAAKSKFDPHLEIAHVLFIDVVGYSKLLVNEQRDVVQRLNEVVRKTPQFRKSEAAGKLIRIPVGDGMALAFFQTPEEPVQCAMEIARALKNHPQIRLRMGIHSGPIDQIKDVNDRLNVTGVGINIAQRVMDCADAGHILISKRVADDLAQDKLWQPHLHELGEVEVKHGAKLGVVNLYTEELGNREVPQKFRELRRQATTSGAGLETKSGVGRWAFVAAAVLIVGVLAIGALFWSRPGGRAVTGLAESPGPAAANVSAAPEKSIAVMPFENLSRDPENAYFADGIQEEILTRLAKIADLKVISRTSTQHFKSSPDNLQQIAKQLGAANILEGSVQRAADQVRVNVQLINAASDAHLWAESFDRKLTDIFAVESDIAKAIAETLRVRLTGAERQQLAKRPTENLRAFQYYLQGRSYHQRNTREDLVTATGYYEKAIEEDRNYALPYAGLADAYSARGVFGYIAPIEGRRKAEEAARKALGLDENLAESHAALGYAYVAFAPYNFSQGDSELRRAIELGPNLALAHFYLGNSFVRQGRLDQALEEYSKARELDPLSSVIARQSASPYYLKRDYARALELLRQANDLGLPLTTTWEIGVYIQNRSFDEALTELERAKRERKDDPILIFDTGMVYAAQGKRAEALQIVKEMEDMSGASLTQAHWIAKMYVALNEKEQALEWLERGLAAGAIGTFYKDDPVWDPIRSDRRFDTLVKKMFTPP